MVRNGSNVVTQALAPRSFQHLLVGYAPTPSEMHFLLNEAGRGGGGV